MKKITTEKSNQLLLKFILKSVLSTVGSLALFIYVFTVVVYKLDMSLENAQVFSIIICALCAFSVSLISVLGLKNNGLVMGILSTLPLLFYCIVNLVFNNTNPVFFAIKATLILAVGALTGFMIVKRSKKFRV